MAAALVLSLVAFVLAADEATAAEQQLSQTAQQEGSSESATVINGKVAEPVPEAAKPPAIPPPVEKLSAKDPVPSPSPPKTEALPAEEPTAPPPVGLAPAAPEPELAPQPPTAPRPTPPQWFAVVVGDGGEVDDPAPVITTPQPVPGSGGIPEPKAVPNASSGLVDPAPAPAAPAAVEVDDGYASGPVPDPELAVPGPTAPAVDFPWAYGRGSPPPRPADGTPAKGSAPPSVPAVPASSLGTPASAVGTVQSAAASVASATAEILWSLAGALPSTTSSTPTDEAQGQPSEGTPQPAPPLAPPGGGSAFSHSAGGGQLGTGGGFAPLVVGVLAILATILLGRDFRTYLVSCEVPKPSSALLVPLERPG